MSVVRVLEKLESYIHEGTWLPAGYRILSEEKLLEFVEKVRSTMPEEVTLAKSIARDQDRVIRAAQEKAEAIVAEASSKHEELLDDHEIILRARTTAEVVLREAEERAAKIRAGADAYAANVLGEMEARLTSAVASVRKGSEALAGQQSRAAAKGQPAKGQPAKGQDLAEAAAQAKRAAFDHQSAQTAELEKV